ncbi:hypothetical protein Hanom_Chr01g00085871 [Helianthus anomalus]
MMIQKEWEKIECLGSYMIYICGDICMCIEAKAPEMENKIFFPRLGSKNGNVVFYSLETHRCIIRSMANTLKQLLGLE